MRRGAERPHTLLRHSNQLYRPAMAVSPEAATRPFNGHLIPAGIEHKIDGGGGTVATGTHTTPDSPGHISRVQCGLNGMFNSHFLRSADRPHNLSGPSLQVPHEGGGLKLPERWEWAPLTPSYDWTKRGRFPGSTLAASDRLVWLLSSRGFRRKAMHHCVKQVPHRLRPKNGLPDNNMLPTCCYQVKGPVTRSEPTTRTRTNASWVKPPLLSSLQGRQ